MAAFIRDHRAEAVKDIATTMRLSQKVVDQSYPAEIGMLSFDGRFDPKALEVIRASLKDLGILGTVPQLGAMYNGSFVPVALN